MTVDVIIPTYTKNDALQRLTLQCLNTMHLSEPDVTFNVLIYEQNKSINYHAHEPTLKVKTVYYDFPFNYNRIMNAGIKKTKNQYILLCNNDLRFMPNFWQELQKGFESGYLSLSPLCPLHQKNHVTRPEQFLEGNIVREQLMGWCIAVDRSIFDHIGKLNEKVEFWYSDNDYSKQLTAAGLTHALCLRSHVYHLHFGSNTLKTLPKELQEYYTNGQLKNYEDAKGN